MPGQDTKPAAASLTPPTSAGVTMVSACVTGSALPSVTAAKTTAVFALQVWRDLVLLLITQVAVPVVTVSVGKSGTVNVMQLAG